jgi:hypothetical protein
MLFTHLWFLLAQQPPRNRLPFCDENVVQKRLTRTRQMASSFKAPVGMSVIETTWPLARFLLESRFC